jgi:hypothetical protein
MANTGNKVSELPTAANVASTDRILVLRDPSGNASVRTVAMSTVSANITISTSVPANNSSNGLPGFMAYDANNLYICVANNTWKSVSLSSF